MEIEGLRESTKDAVIARLMEENKRLREENAMLRYRDAELRQYIKRIEAVSSWEGCEVPQQALEGGGNDD